MERGLERGWGGAGEGLGRGLERGWGRVGEGVGEGLGKDWGGLGFYASNMQVRPKERRRLRAEKRLSKRVFLESPFLLCPLKVCALKTPENLKGAEKKRTLQTTLLNNRFSARSLLRSFGAL